MSQTVQLKEVKTGHECREADPAELITEHVTHISQDETVSYINLPGDYVETESYSGVGNSSTDAYAEMTVDKSEAADSESYLLYFQEQAVGLSHSHPASNQSPSHQCPQQSATYSGQQTTVSALVVSHSKYPFLCCLNNYFVLHDCCSFF